MIEINKDFFKIEKNIFKPRLSKAALFSFILIFLPLSLYIIFLIYLLLIFRVAPLPSFIFISLKPVFLLFFAVISLIFGVFSKAVIYNSAGVYKGQKLSEWGIKLSKISLVIFMLISIISPIGEVLAFITRILVNSGIYSAFIFMQLNEIFKYLLDAMGSI